MVDKHKKLHDLQRMKTWCLALLFSCIAMSVVLELLYAHTNKLWLIFLKGAFEAAVVGAMADWYAVVALFKHPLGISRLPHTAIIPKKKDDIGENLGKFVRDEFMQDEIVIAKVAEFKPVDKFFNWVATSEQEYLISNFLRNAVISLLADKSAAYINEFARQNIVKFVESTDAANVLAKIAVIFDNDRYRNDLLDIILDKVLLYVSNEKDTWIEKVKSEGVWGTKWIGGKYVDGFIDAVFEKLEEVRADNNHDIKIQIKLLLHNLIEKLQHDPEAIATVNKFKHDFMESPKFIEFVSSSVAHMKSALINDLNSTDSYLVEHVHTGIMALVQKYREDDEFNEHLNGLLQKLIKWLLQHKDKIAEHLAEQVKAWSPETVSEKLELEIGKDLQWIRVSGTLVGGLVGGIFSTVLYLLH